jgi:hypothetical protein
MATDLPGAASGERSSSVSSPGTEPVQGTGLVAPRSTPAEPLEPAIGPLARWWEVVLGSRPLLALAIVWMTTAGHTMNFREMGAHFGWVPIEAFSLQTCYLFGIGAMLLLCPYLSPPFSCRALARSGIAAFMVAGLVNGLGTHLPLRLAEVSRLLAGAGGGLVIYYAPRLLEPRWQLPAAWASFLFPAAGPAVIGLASEAMGQSAWEGSFLFQGLAALLALALLVSMDTPPEQIPDPNSTRAPLACLPWLGLAVGCLWYCLHWGQLHGWLESFDVVVAAALGLTASALFAWLVWPALDFALLRANVLRLVLCAYGGLVLFYFVPEINIYAGLLVNLTVWQRSWIVWSLPLGVAASLALVHLIRSRRHVVPGRLGVILGLLFLAGGTAYALSQALAWPFWDVRNHIDLNWFQAPQAQYNPPRFLMGFGIGLLLVSLEHWGQEHEEKVRPFLLPIQFLGGGLGAGLLVNFLLIGQPIHYSYTSERDYIQAEELAQRRALLRDELSRAGLPGSEQEANTVLYRAVRFEADSLTFASVYYLFMISALILAGLTAMTSIAGRLLRWGRPG